MICACRTILVVDDEPGIVKSVQDLLRLDYRVLGASSAKEGIEIMHHEEVHVVMTDQRMPEMTGVDFLKQLCGEYPEAIRILFTGYIDLKSVVAAVNQGHIYRYISKPWDPIELQVAVKDACAYYETHSMLMKIEKRIKSTDESLEKILVGHSIEMEKP